MVEFDSVVIYCVDLGNLVLVGDWNNWNSFCFWFIYFNEFLKGVDKVFFYIFWVDSLFGNFV